MIKIFSPTIAIVCILMLFIAGVTLITRDNTTWAYILLGLAFIYLLLTIFFRSKNREKNSEEKTKKKNTSLRLDKQTLKALKIRAIEQETTVQNLVESLIKDYLSKG